MANNVIDSAHRFGRKERQERRSITDEIIWRSPRVSAKDRLMIAQKLGSLAARLDPEHPDRPAKRWFSKWDGDRWSKRKKFIQFPGEECRDPNLPGQVAANSGDWVGLINAAIEECYPGQGIVVERDRERLKRQLLRGTTYLPDFQEPLGDTFGAGELLQRLVDKICNQVRAGSELPRLWQALQVTPFDLERTKDECFAQPKYQSDDLEAAALRAADIADLIYWSDFQRCVDDCKFRFSAESASDLDLGDAEEADWAYPKVRIGLIGTRRDTRIFQIPDNYISLAVSESDPHPCPTHAAYAWLCAQGIWDPDDLDPDNRTLPEVDYDAELGFGWKPFSYDVVRDVWIQCRPKANGELGLWLTISSDRHYSHWYPFLPGFDCLALEAECPADLLSNLPFYPEDMGGMFVDDELIPIKYDLFDWPTYDPVFGELPGVALSGLIEWPDEEELLSGSSIPDMAGWLDDLDDEELQRLLFGLPAGSRFLPSIAVDDEAPLPCRRGSIAGAIFGNLECAEEDQLAHQLVSAAERVSDAGLAFHRELLAHYHRLISQIGGH